MNKIILSLLTAILISNCATVYAYDSGEVNKRLVSCTPSKNLAGSGSTLYQISGLTGDICIFKIQYGALSKRPDLICKVPSARMGEMVSFNPAGAQAIKKQYCVISTKSLNSQKRIYY